MLLSSDIYIVHVGLDDEDLPLIEKYLAGKLYIERYKTDQFMNFVFRTDYDLNEFVKEIHCPAWIRTKEQR